MKKTLIALAVATSAAVSGSAMAWTANGDGGSVSLSGTAPGLSVCGLPSPHCYLTPDHSPRPDTAFSRCIQRPVLTEC